MNGAAVTLDDSGCVLRARYTPRSASTTSRSRRATASASSSRKQLDVLWAPDYLPPMAGTTAFEVPDALDLYLGQRFFDARQFGTTLDMSTDPVVAHDLGVCARADPVEHRSREPDRRRHPRRHRQLDARHHDPVGDARGDHRRRDGRRRLGDRSVDRSQRRVPRDDGHVPLRQQGPRGRRRHLGRHARVGAPRARASTATARSG